MENNIDNILNDLYTYIIENIDKYNDIKKDDFNEYIKRFSPKDNMSIDASMYYCINDFFNQKKRNTSHEVFRRSFFGFSS